MTKYKPMKFFIFRFTADDGKHTVHVGTSDAEGAVEYISETYSNVRNLKIIPIKKQE